MPGFLHDYLTTGSMVTWAKFIELPDADRRELIDGQLVVLEVPTGEHEWAVMVLASALFQWAREHGGITLPSGYKVRIREDRGVMPDAQYFRSGRGPLPSAGLHTGAPDLVVEVISPSSVRHDRVVKRAYYADIGVPEYWLVDPFERVVERLVLEDGVYSVVETLRSGDFEPSSFPGLCISVDELFTIPG